MESSYDPPVALTARDAQATVSMPQDPSSRSGAPGSTPHLDGPMVTWSPTSTSLGPEDPKETMAPLVTVVDSALGAHTSQHTGAGPPSSETLAIASKSSRTRTYSDPAKPTMQSEQTTASASHTSTSTIEERHGTDLPVPDLQDTTSAAAATEPSSEEPTGPQPKTGVASETPAPYPLSSGGVVVGHHTVRVGEEQTFGSGASATLISVLKHGESTFVVYDHNSTAPAGSARKGGSSHFTSAADDIVSMNSRSQYVVDGQTLAPSSPITLTGNAGPVTFRMLTSSSRTFVAIGSTTTIPLFEASSSAVPLAFTKASDGNFVLHGTTLASGKPVTVGEGIDRTTLRMTTVSGAPAVVVDGTTTKLLGHAPVASSAGQSVSGSLPPVITHASAPPVGPASTSDRRVTTSATSTSGATRGASRLSAWSALMLILLGFVP